MRSKRRSMVESPLKRKLLPLHFPPNHSAEHRLDGVLADTPGIDAVLVSHDLKRTDVKGSLAPFPTFTATPPGQNDFAVMARVLSPVHNATAAVLSIAGNHHFK